MGSGFVGLRIKDTLTGESRTISRNWLILEEVVPPRLAKNQDVKA
jgi:hypothetical protein